MIPKIGCVQHDCEECRALRDAAQQVAWPTNAAEIREFIGSNFNSREGDEEPSDNDKYSLTAHDLLSAFSEWVDFVDMDALRARRTATLATSQEQRDWCLSWHEQRALQQKPNNEGCQ